MAEQMQGIKRRIRSINSTERITNAMKLVSAAKLRRAKAVYEHSKLFLDRIKASMDETFDNAASVPKQFLVGSREIKTTCLVIMTSSTGLCGSFNGNVIRYTEKLIKEAHHDAKLVTIGSKGREHFQRMNYDILIEHDGTADTVTFEETQDIAGPLIEKYLAGEIDEIILVYTSYINTLKQEVTTRRILPIDMNEIKADEKAEDALIDKAEGKGFEEGEDKDAGPQPLHSIEYEPSAEEVFRYLVPKYFQLHLYSAAIESATCEHAARRQAMENANDNASDMLTMLQVKYNRARQSQITDAIIEIVSGSEAQS
ncbi:ATP synthase F1 subunit gamma [Aminicella lysinilytica]|uniref:ATP synthase gamma chain n=1 Tax=Aminicella lysinilytica TaxID=433323 RepID=A0A4V3CS20_9FIRM|nr:ATP synthase F1 subunit gamma [Aminicella lysinilytica]NLD11249.1 ATP synthase F1 subunit gamma [Clostridiales bacterium]TDP58942.1 ATP synthase F1 subcomplex gamma subunit [Aminicella lysinilytica]